ncbi:hypothetical protein [Roseomonas elaeocarpi]|uniref:Uncharacterized protein n=1 Tax=Roseomonas elaeocarpi TaxID=907779 RepID=A0ABV6JRU8_9PROT
MPPASPSPRRLAPVAALLILLLAALPAGAQRPPPDTPPAPAAAATEQARGESRFTVPAGWSGGPQANGTWLGRRDFTGERGQRGSALIQVARPISHAAGPFETVFAQLAASIPELAKERPTTKGQGVTVNNHRIAYDHRCCGRRNGVSLASETVAIDDGTNTHVMMLVTLGLRGDDARAAWADFDALVRSFRPRATDRAFALEPPAGAGGLDGVFSHLSTGIRPNAFGGTDFYADNEVLVFDPKGLFSHAIPSGTQDVAAHCREEPTDCGTYSLAGGGLLGGAERIEMREVGHRFGIMENETQPLRRDGGNLRIGETLHQRVPPLPSDTRFNGTWRYFFASSGTGAFSSGGVASERLLTLTPDGRFRRTGFTGASSTNEVGGGTTGFTAGRERPAESGRYEAAGFRLTLRGDDGREEVLSIFRPDGSDDGDKLLVIDGRNYLRQDNTRPARR